MSQSPAGSQLDSDFIDMADRDGMLTLMSQSPAGSQLDSDSEMTEIHFVLPRNVAIPRRVSARFRPDLFTSVGPDGNVDVAIPRRVSARFRPPGAAADTHETCMSQSPAGSQLDSDGENVELKFFELDYVAIPRRVSARFRLWP